MSTQENKGSVLVGIIVFVLIIIGLVLINNWLQKAADEIVSKPEEILVIEPLPEKKKPVKVIKKTEEVFRKIWPSPDRTYRINIYYQDGVEIARNTEKNGEFYDQTGEIPDGKVKFINETNETYGVEYYLDQKLNGSSRMFYKDGVLMSESLYQFGKLMTRAKYYYDGTVRREEDYTNARGNLNGPETGIGKVYSRDGMIMYEWHFTVTEPIGFRKRYDSRGIVYDAEYYNEFDQRIEPEETVSIPDEPEEPVTVFQPDIIGNPSDPPPIEKPPKQIFIPSS